MEHLIYDRAGSADVRIKKFKNEDSVAKLAELDINEIYRLSNGDVVMEHLVGGEYDDTAVRSDGWWVFRGECGRMKPVHKFTEEEALRLVNTGG